MRGPEAGDVLLLMLPLCLQAHAGDGDGHHSALAAMVHHLHERRLVLADCAVPTPAIQRCVELAASRLAGVGTRPQVLVEDLMLELTICEPHASAGVLLCVPPRALLACMTVAERGGHFMVVSVGRLQKVEADRA